MTTAFRAAFPRQYNYYRKQARQTWVQYGRYMQGMIALALFRTGDGERRQEYHRVQHLQQNAIRDEEKGMYWKEMEGGYYWYQAPVEIQSLLIEAFHEISGDAGIDRQLKTWLLKQKQTHSWATTKATADACYALLLGGTEWLNAERDIEVKLGDKTIEWGGERVRQVTEAERRVPAITKKYSTDHGLARSVDGEYRCDDADARKCGRWCGQNWGERGRWRCECRIAGMGGRVLAVF